MKRTASLLALLFLLALALLSLTTTAQDSPQTGEPSALDQAPPLTTEQLEELRTFVPSETLPADSAISFPSDI